MKPDKKSCLKWTETIWKPFQTSKRSISKTFPINKCWQGPSQRPLTHPLAPKLIKIVITYPGNPSICSWQTERPESTKTTPKHQNNNNQSVFQPTKSIGDPSKGVWHSFGKSQILPILECGNRTFKTPQLFLKKYWSLKLFAILSGHERRPF